MMLSISHVLIGHLYVIFEEIPIWFFARFGIGLFVFLLLNCKNSLQVLDIPYQIYDWQIFSPIFFFLLLMVSFDSQTFFIFMPNLSIFWLCHVACEILFAQPGIQSSPLAVKVQSPNHWTDRKLLVTCAFDVISQILLLNQRLWRFTHKFFLSVL